MSSRTEFSAQPLRLCGDMYQTTFNRRDAEDAEVAQRRVNK